MQRINAQYCTMVNPYNRAQISHVSLKPQDVKAMVFWTKNAKPLMPYLAELDRLGYRYYFHYTLNGYGKLLEPNVPPIEECLQTFCDLSAMIGPERVIWRYDPILISNITDKTYHKAKFTYILERLYLATRRIVISFADDYRKASAQFRRLSQNGMKISLDKDATDIGELAEYIAKTSSKYQLEVFSCAETIDLRPFGVKAGKCIDGGLIEKLFGVRVTAVKDKSQRAECGCVVSKDIGHYDTCLHGCAYCYAGTLRSGEAHRSEHRPESPSLLGVYDAKPKPVQNVLIHQDA